MPPARNFRVEFARYFACSAAALAADFGVFFLAIRLGLGYGWAAALGFVVGVCVAYALSVRFVFRTRAVADARAEFIVFAVIGVLGLLLTEALLWLLISRVGLGPSAAKLLTAGAVFVSNFLLRKAILFSSHTERVHA